MSDVPDNLTPAEYARYRRCSLRTLDRERAEGRGCPYARLGGRILYRRTDIEKYLAANINGGRINPSPELGLAQTRERGGRRRRNSEPVSGDGVMP